MQLYSCHSLHMFLLTGFLTRIILHPSAVGHIHAELISYTVKEIL